MRVRPVLAVSVLLAGSAVAASRAGEKAPDPKATAVADRVMEALGGAEAWNKTRYLRFDFAVDRAGKTIVRRSHTWDKWTGRYRLEATTKDGEPYVVLMDIDTKDGRAWLEGAELQGDEAKKYLEQGHAVWVNDTYWLLMPYKMKDPGVVLALDGVEKKGGEAWDKVRLTFDNVGLTPRDKYWAYVNRKTGLVDRWDYVLKGESKPPTTFTWGNWKRYGNVMLADDRVNPADGTRIHFPVLETPDSVAETAFTTP
jgi:hypothetical protein